MARPDSHVIITTPSEGWNGLDLRSTIFNVGPDYAKEATNIDTTQASGSLISRAGRKGAISNTAGGYGLLRYAYLNTSTGQNTVEELIVKDNLYKISSAAVTITYSGAGTSVYANHLVTSSDGHTGTWLFELYVDSVQVLSYSTSVGFDEGSIPTLATLKTAIDAVTDFSCSIAAALSTSLPAAMAIPTLVAEPFSSGTLTITCEYDSILYKPGGVTTTFAATAAARNSAYFENASSYNVNSVIYINTGYDAQKKYDGQKVYNSGLPAPATSFAAAVGGGGSVNAGDHIYTMFYRQRDYRGNVCEGEESAQVTVSPGVGSIINLTLPNIQNTTGYNTDQAIVNGNQTGVTTINTNTHSLKIGDPVAFIDRATGLLVTDRSVTATPSATSITISGAAVDVNNNDIISAGLTIQICRTKVGDSTPFYVFEVPNNSASATQAYADNVADSTLSVVFDRPPIGFEHGLPPACRYGVLFSGIPVLTGSFTDGDAVYYADTTNPEHFPSLNSFVVRSRDQDVNTGLFSSQEYLLVFKNRATYLVSGDLANDDYIVQERTLQVGCASHHSIVQLADGSVAFMSFRGPQRLAGSGEPDNIGYNVLPLFASNNTGDYALQLKRSIAVSDIKQNKVMFFIPCETTTSGEVAANTNSIVLMMDTQRGKSERDSKVTAARSDLQAFGNTQVGSWFLWTNINMAGGALLIDDQFRFMERRYSTYSGGLAFHIYKELRTGTIYDFVDHISSIDWRYTSGWETLGAPSVYKLPLRHKIYCQDALIAPQFEMTVQTQLDYTETVNTEYTVSVGTAGSSGGYGIDPYGSSAYGSPAAQEVMTNLKRTRCQAFAYSYSHNMIYASPLITSWETEVSVPFNTEIKK